MPIRRNDNSRSVPMPGGPLWLEDLLEMARLAAEASPTRLKIKLDIWEVDSVEEMEEVIRREGHTFPDGRLRLFQISGDSFRLLLDGNLQTLWIEPPYLTGDAIAVGFARIMNQRLSPLRRFVRAGQSVDAAHLRGLLLGVVPGLAAVIAFWLWQRGLSLTNQGPTVDVLLFVAAPMVGVVLGGLLSVPVAMALQRPIRMYVVTKREAPPWWQRNRDGMVTNAIFYVLGLVTPWIVSRF